MPWRSLGRAVGAVLVVAASVVLLLGVGVRTGEATRGSCGSPFDAISGRTSWEVWRSQDFDDPATVSGDALARTRRCPDAVNGRVVVAGVLVGLAVVVVSAAELLAGSRSRPPRAAARRPAEQLRTLGMVVTVVGFALMIAGLLGLVLLVADPGSTLFLYVGRGVVSAIGLVVLLPVVALVVAGRALVLVARALEEEGPVP